jgi:hypothetical protein
MKPLLALLGVGAACAACCAIPLALPLIGGLAVSGALGAIAGWPLALGAGALAAIAAAAWHLRRRRDVCAIKPARENVAACGCDTGNSSAGTSCGSAR